MEEIKKSKYITNYFDIKSERDINNFGEEFFKHLLKKDIDLDNIVFLCIGTDRATGDSLGPIVGNLLDTAFLYKKINVFGTLKKPVHAINLEKTVESIYKESKNPLIIAIDACLGKNENIGKITLSNKPIKPGAGANKNLPYVGDITITGIVNDSDLINMNILQNTRLNIVVNMSNIICTGIIYAVIKLNYLKST
jgi:putative sporulation protein YyaC